MAFPLLQVSVHAATPCLQIVPHSLTVGLKGQRSQSPHSPAQSNLAGPLGKKEWQDLHWLLEHSLQSRTNEEFDK